MFLHSNATPNRTVREYDDSEIVPGTVGKVIFLTPR